MKIGLYAGTFDPPTKGHLDIIGRAAQLFPQLIVGIAENSEKKPFLPVKERVQLLKRAVKKWSNVQVIAYQGLTWEFAKREGVEVLVRSFRPGEDVSMEFSLAAANRQLGELETLFLAADPEVSFVSSSLVREIIWAGGNAEAYLA